MPRDCQSNTDDKDGNDEQEALFLREKIVEVAREGDSSEMEYLLGVSIARKLLTAVDKVSKHSSGTRTRTTVILLFVPYVSTRWLRTFTGFLLPPW